MADIYVDGALTGRSTSPVDRPDIAAAFPGYGPAHGFDVELTAPYGVHEVCVIALHAAGTSGPDTPLGCRTMVILAALPFGAVDAMIPTADGVRVQGWGIDPFSYFWTSTCGLSPNLCPPRHDLLIDVVVDGAVALHAPANVNRPDVTSGAPFMWTDGTAGFDDGVALSPGAHDVCVVVEHHPAASYPPASVAAPDATIGCATVVH